VLEVRMLSHGGASADGGALQGLKSMGINEGLKLLGKG